MNALLIIALLVGLAAIAIGIIAFMKYPALKSESEKLRNTIGFMEQEVKRNKENILKLQADLEAQRQNILDLSASVAKLIDEKESEGGLIKEITYDPKKKTVNIAGNLATTGWVVSGGLKMED